MRQLGAAVPVAEIHRMRLDAIQRLLGDTIGISDAEWREPSLLPGWSRAHVATHLARNADLLRELTLAAIEGRSPVEHTAAERLTALELGADRSGLELQIDLDTAAGALNRTWEEVTDWQLPVTFQGRTAPLAELPLARLHEVCLHHLDLKRAFDTDAIGPDTAGWLLAWVYRRLSLTWGKPPIEFRSQTGELGLIGSGSRVVGPVRGADADLWAWLCGRIGPERLTGAGTLRLPLLA